MYTIVITFHQIISKPFATYINPYPTPYLSIGVQIEISAYTIVITFHQWIECLRHCDSSTIRFLLYFQSSSNNVSPCYHPNLKELKFHYVYTQKCSKCSANKGIDLLRNEQELQGQSHLQVSPCYQLQVISGTWFQVATLWQHQDYYFHAPQEVKKS